MRIMYIMLNSRNILRTAVLLALASPLYGDESSLLEQSRQITAEYAAQLQGALQDAMASGGPVAAISVCAEIAPQIASDLSRTSGARVRRTSLRYRNPANAPDTWEREALQQLETNDSSELFETDRSGDARYLKAIPTAPVCIACHGKSLTPEIQAKLDETYPHDLARGFNVGDLRGAFSVSWPVRTQDDSSGSE
jgi:hypothetical protein